MAKIYGEVGTTSETKQSSASDSKKETVVGTLTPPEPLQSYHLIGHFDCGEQSMNEWLLNHAVSNHQKDFSRVFVVTKDNHVIAYYSLSSYKIDRKDIQSIKRGPREIPAVLLGRLAVDKQYQGLGLGENMIKDAIERITVANESLAIKVIIVHALNETVSKFYQKIGFELLTNNHLELFMPIEDAKEMLRIIHSQ
jgi:predicted N-acetyltransferase YhbS